MKLVTWNVNSLNVRLPRLLDWLAANTPDVVCLQETKLEDAKFPRGRSSTPPATRRTSPDRRRTTASRSSRAHGLAVTDVAIGVDGFVDEQKRVIAATVDGIRVISAYVPNGQSVDSDKYRYKLAWCDAVGDASARRARAASRSSRSPATSTSRPEDRDVHDPALWAGQVLCSEPERAAFRDVASTPASSTASGCSTSRRRPSAGGTTGMLAFPKNRGLRIDHILLSAAACRALHVVHASTATRARARSRRITRR